MSHNDETIIAKISRPRISGTFHRERLLRLLDSGREKPAIWVAGPPGAGKTTLISSYVDSRKFSTIWYQIDESDVDLASFFYYLGRAGMNASTTRTDPLPLLTPEYVAGIPTFSRRFFESLANRMKPPALIIFDNYQEASASPGLNAIMLQGIAAMPPGVTLVMISRTEPLPDFVRLRANDGLAVLNATDLRFTEDESSELVRTKERKSLPVALIRQLHEQTQGWAAGLVLYLEMARTSGVTMPHAGARPPEDIFHYFAGELLDKTDADTRHFLLTSSLLTNMTVPVTEAVTGDANAGRILSDLYRNNYFITQRTEPDPVYQYHPLFREFLLERAREQFPEAELAALRTKAAVYYERFGRIEDAGQLYLESGGWADAGRMICAAAPALLSQGRFSTLVEWIDRMPKEILGQAGYLLYFRGAGLMAANPGQCRNSLEQALKLFKAGGDRAGIFLAWAGLVMNAVYEGRDFRCLDDLILEFEAASGNDGTFPSPEIEVRATAGMFLALMLRQPQHPRIAYWEERLSRMLDLIPDRNLRIHNNVFLAIYNLVNANFVRAATIIAAIRGDADAADVTPVSFLQAQTAIALYAWLTAACDDALATVANALERAEESGVRILDMNLLQHGAASALSAGDLAAADAFLKRLAPMAATMRRMDALFYRLLIAWHHLARHDPAQALEDIKDSSDILEQMGWPINEAMGHAVLAQLHFEVGNDERADEHLETGLQSSRVIGSRLVEFICLTYQAHMAFVHAERQAQGKSYENLLRSGRETLARAFALGRERRIFNAHLWRSDIMAGLCVRALQQGIEPDYARELVRKRNLAPDTPPLEVDAWPWQFDVATLGNFALAINGQPLVFSGKVQKKPLELLKALIAFGGRDVAESAVSEALWPDADGDVGRRSFDTTLHRLRKVIGNDKAIRIEEGKLTLDPCLWRIDVWTFDRLCALIEEKSRMSDRVAIGDSESSDTQSPDAEIVILINKALGLYQGHFLSNDSEGPWTISTRERLAARFRRLVSIAGMYCEKRDAWEAAKAYYEKGLDIDSVMEKFHQGIMRCCLRLDRKAEAVSAYNRCRTVLLKTLGIEPSPKTEELFVSIKSIGDRKNS